MRSKRTQTTAISTAAKGIVYHLYISLSKHGYISVSTLIKRVLFYLTGTETDTTITTSKALNTVVKSSDVEECFISDCESNMSEDSSYNGDEAESDKETEECEK